MELIILVGVVFFGLGAWMLWSKNHQDHHPQKH